MHLQSWTKSGDNFALSYSQQTHPQIGHHGGPSPLPPYSKLDIQGAFFLQFLSKIVAIQEPITRREPLSY